jgi:S-adenosylmethionine decarboxylase
VVIIDYTVRGSTRDAAGRRVYLDHPMRSIQDFIDPAVLAAYECTDLALPSHNVWQTKLLRTRFDIPTYFRDVSRVADEDRRRALEVIQREMVAVANGRPE